MTRTKKLLVLLLAFALLWGATLIAQRLDPENQTEEVTPLLALSDQSITGLTWTYGEEALTFTQANGAWSYSEDPAFPLDESYLTAMTDALAELTARKTIDDPQDLSQYGLDAPACTIQVTLDTGTTQLTIGGESTLDGLRYLSTGSDAVYLVDPSLLDAFSYGLYDLIRKEDIPAMTDVHSFTVETAGNTLSLTTQETEGGDAWIVQADGESVTLDTSLTDSFVETVTQMYWGQCLTYDASDEVLALYGLEDPAATVTVDYTETTEEEAVDSTFVLELGSANGDYCYARMAGSGMVYLVSGSILETMTTTTTEDLLPADE